MVRRPLHAPAWTDASSHDPGIALVELLAFLGDALSWYQDQIANEARLKPRWRHAVVLAALAGLACRLKYKARRS
jgi:hypothetical protein